MKFSRVNLSHSNILGTRVIESEHALVSPKAAISDDMRHMVEDLDRFGQIRLKPGAFEINGVLYVHPQVYDALSKRLAREADRLAMDAIYGRRGR